jgi:hypothetical protein
MIKAQNVIVTTDSSGVEVPYADITVGSGPFRRFTGVRFGSIQLRSLASGLQTLNGSFVIQGSNVTSPLVDADWTDLVTPGIGTINLTVTPVNQVITLVGPPMRYNRLKWVHTSGSGRIQALFFAGNELASDQ